MTTSDQSSAGGGSEPIQVFILIEKAYASICAHVGSIPLMLV